MSEERCDATYDGQPCQLHKRHAGAHVYFTALGVRVTWESEAERLFNVQLMRAIDDPDEHDIALCDCLDCDNIRRARASHED